MKRRTAILFDNFGPYHMARLQGAANVFELLAIEFGTASSEYAWNKIESNGFQRAVINEAGTSRKLGTHNLRIRLDRILSEFNPEVIFVPGWSSREALLSLLWGVGHGVPVVVMSESTAWDERRNIFKEWIKRRVISFFSAGLVGGLAHQEYLIKLGMKRERIFMGYDAVDNNYFRQQAEEARSCSLKLRSSLALPQNYFLASARFIEKKNLSGLLKAYARYRKLDALRSPNTKSVSWELVLLGDGPLRCELETLRSTLALEEYIHMPGFKQYEDLATYYAMAEVFIHASTTEQWGLVVNEAMASGLPVLVSNRCGCAPDLVQEGQNGWTFDPTDEESIAALLARVSLETTDRTEMGKKSREIISKWSPDRFAKGSFDAAQIALKSFRPQELYFTRMLLELLCRR